MHIDGTQYEFTSSDLKKIKELGRGHFASVEKMVHTRSNVVMAVKQLRCCLEEKEQRDVLEKHDLLIAKLDSKFIVKFYGAIFCEGACWICMELLDCTLNDFYKFICKSVDDEGKPAHVIDSMIAHIAYAAVEACNYLKMKHQIMHRDIKPTNILLNKNGEVKLCDFGIAGKLVDSIALSRDVGCLTYLPPERIDWKESKKGYTAKSDVWSLGVTLMEVSLGHYPFQTDVMNEFKLLELVVYNPLPDFEPTEKRPDDLCDFVKRCMDKNPETRPSFAELLEHEFLTTERDEEFIKHFTDHWITEWQESVGPDNVSGLL